jgi:hypothetical protein
VAKSAGDPAAGRAVVSLTVRNARAVAVTFYLEPWGEEYPMPPGAAFQVVARGPEGDALELEAGDDGIIVYGWPGSVVGLFHNGEELGGGRGERQPVPATPPGMGVATFMRTLFGVPVEPPASPSDDSRA